MVVKDELMNIARLVKIDGALVFPAVFYGDNWETNNSQTDNGAYPLCQVSKILSGGFDINQKTGRFKNKWNVFIFFCDKTPDTDLDTTAVKEDEVIERMRAACRQYMADLIKTQLFDLPTKVEEKILSFMFDASVSGVLAYFQIVERVGQIPC